MTTEKLLKLQPEQIVEQVLAKAGVINFARVVNMVADICALKKIPTPDESAVLKMILSKSYVVVERQLFIAKSELCYSREQRRLIAIRDFVLKCLSKAKEPVAISTLIEATKSNFKELTPVLENVGQRVLIPKGLVSVAHYSLKTPTDIADRRLALQEHLKAIRQEWKVLEARNAESQKSGFYYTEARQIREEVKGD